MTETLSARLKSPSESRKEAVASENLQKAQEDAKSRQSQTEPNNFLVVQELCSNEADETLVKDEPATQSHGNNGSKSANDSKDISNNIGGLIEAFSGATLETTAMKKTPPDLSWFESILSKVDSILEKTADRGQSKGGDENLAIERRNDVLITTIEAALELGSTILDSPRIARKFAAEQDVQNEDLRNAVPSDGTETNNSTDKNPIFASTLCENCSGALAPCQQVEVPEEPTQESRDRSIWFEYHSKKPQGLYYTIDLYERVHSFHLEKYGVKSGEKTVARLHVPIKSPPPTRRPPNFDASKVQIINAISGWVPVSLATGCPNPFIPNDTWTEKVKEMCKSIGYELQNNQKDQRKPGTYNACHGEKQVIAYWIHNYVAKLHPCFRMTNWTKECELPIRPEYYEGLFIVVSNSLCDCCERFLNHVAAYYSISFTVHCPDKVFQFSHLGPELQRDD